LKNLFQENKDILFLHQKMQPRKKGRYSVILSPQFYWVKKVQLPVKSTAQAKKLAQSVFEGNLPDGDYSYEVNKVGGEFIIIAYDKENLSQLINDYFIDEAKVDAIYFSQYEFSDLDACCAIDSDSSLVNMGGLLIQIPRNCTDPKIRIEDLTQNRKLSRHKIKLGTFEEEAIDKKTFIFTASAVALIFSALVLESIGYKKEAAKIEEQKSRMIQKLDLPATSMQLKSIKNNLYKTYKKQKKLRDELYLFSKIPLKQDEYIRNIELNEKGALIEIKVKDARREKEIRSSLSKKYKIVQSDLKDDILTIKISS